MNFKKVNYLQNIEQSATLLIEGLQYTEGFNNKKIDCLWYLLERTNKKLKKEKLPLFERKNTLLKMFPKNKVKNLSNLEKATTLQIEYLSNSCEMYEGQTNDLWLTLLAIEEIQTELN